MFITDLHHQYHLLRVDAGWRTWKQLLFRDHERELEVLEITKTAVSHRLHEPHAVAGAGDLELSFARRHQPACDGVVRHQSPGQGSSDEACSLHAMAVRRYHLQGKPQPQCVIHGREGESGGGRVLAGGDESGGQHGDGEPHGRESSLLMLMLMLMLMLILILLFACGLGLHL
ncbi:hypothetical protein MUK42_25593 [Musa troglodytarum]|uniref:Uncharacterized protein n=1 Tax=Musa troglodytarum TaxID=320322 RepID=A0A9E7KQS2_9LILI|nr:hypothetical protein MUK42_25593 [Musa troglodytarum]